MNLGGASDTNNTNIEVLILCIKIAIRKIWHFSYDNIFAERKTVKWRLHLMLI
jgi:hypothetical protein